jgi:hypothetical protein
MPDEIDGFFAGINLIHDGAPGLQGQGDAASGSQVIFHE